MMFYGDNVFGVIVYDGVSVFGVIMCQGGDLVEVDKN
jgi:hypothetical protein